MEMPHGSLNSAVVPVPSTKPALPGLPATVVTRPDDKFKRRIKLTVLESVSVCTTNRALWHISIDDDPHPVLTIKANVLAASRAMLVGLENVAKEP